MPGTSQGSAYPVSCSIRTSFNPDVSPETNSDTSSSSSILGPDDGASPGPAADLQVDSDSTDTDEAAVTALLATQPTKSRSFSRPIDDGVAARVPTWQSRARWLAMCEWVAMNTDRGRTALRRYEIALSTFLATCAAHAAVAESSTGRRVTASLATLQTRSGLSKDALRRGRRVMRELEFGVELARGKLLDRIEREAAARLHEESQGVRPDRPQRGAASVWALSSPLWAVEAMPEPEPRRRPSRRRHRTAIRRPVPTASRPCSAPQSFRASSRRGSSVGKNSPTRERAGSGTSTVSPRSINLQRAAAVLIDRIPALRSVVGSDPALSTGRHRHVGVVCDLLVHVGIDTSRWTGIDIVDALNRSAAQRGWTWPTSAAMSSPLGLLKWRLSRIDWSGPSPTQNATAGRGCDGESPADIADRLVKARRAEIAAFNSSTRTAPPASAEHRKAMREAFIQAQTRRRHSTVAGVSSGTQTARQSCPMNIPAIVRDSPLDR